MKNRIIGGLVVAAVVLPVDGPGDGSTIVIVNPNSEESCFYKVEVRY